ncbi:hypothetical protein Tco_0889182 [Tanacetum coccineum]
MLYQPHNHQVHHPLGELPDRNLWFQPRSPTQTNVADKAASTGMYVRLGGAATTATGLEAGQGSGNIDKTPTMPHDSPLPRVHTLGSDKGIMKHNELMDLVAKLSDRVQGRHEHDMEPDFEFITAEEVYTAEKEVSTAKSVSTAGASVSTAGASLAKDKEALRLQAEIDEEERQRIARVQKEASSLNIKEWDDIQARVEADEEFS